MKVSKLPNGEPEIFHTIQGEGINTGRPSVFLRLSLCNLHCQWCDTPYTWNWHNTPWKTISGEKFAKKQSILELSTAEVSSLLQKINCRNLVITGGEPLLQQQEICLLLDQLGENWNVEIETNGTIIPDLLQPFSSIQYNVSPKLSHSGNPAHLAINSDALQWFSHHPLTSFKFVINSDQDLAELQDIASRHNIPAEKIFLMPEGNNSEKLRAQSHRLIALCLKYSYRFSDRLHVHLWGNTRAK